MHGISFTHSLQILVLRVYVLRIYAKSLGIFRPPLCFNLEGRANSPPAPAKALIE